MVPLAIIPPPGNGLKQMLASFDHDRNTSITLYVWHALTRSLHNKCNYISYHEDPSHPL